ncbi:MAG: hypothetical protein ACXW4B_11015 [Micavibrio sp.]
MTIKFEDYARSEITAILEETIEKAVASYYCYAKKDLKEENAKDVTEYHKSCKVAAAHLDLLIKLARWADKTGTSEDPNIDEAQKLFETYKEQHAGQEDDSE